MLPKYQVKHPLLLVQVLLSHGASVGFTGERGRNALHFAACSYSHNQGDSVVRLLLGTEEGLSLIDSRDDGYLTPVHLASAGGNVGVCEVG